MRIMYRYAASADDAVIQQAVTAAGGTDIQAVRDGIGHCTVPDDFSAADQVMDRIREIPDVDFVHVVTDAFQ